MKISQKIISTYKPADRFFIFHKDDPDVTPVKILLPRPPPLYLIDGYGLAPEEQKFTPPEYPVRLAVLERTVQRELEYKHLENRHERITGQKLLEAIWERLKLHKKEYVEEIRWMKKMWYYRLNGYWCFINGKPTYLPGWFFMYCSFFKLDIGLPDYRDRDRRFFLVAWYVFTCTENALGQEMNLRTLYGIIYPKHRRDGATYKCLCILYCIITTLKNALGGIQSFDDDNAGEHFREKLIPAWQEMPFFFRAMWDGTNNPKKELSMKLPASKFFGDQLKSKINYASTAKRKFYDGKKQYANLMEEEGKTILEDVTERWDVVKQTLAQGAGGLIHGFSMHPSTVADMKEQGGQNYYNIAEDSKFYERNLVHGQTLSGLIRIFFPAWDGLEGFVGTYGESIIDKPTEEQERFIKRPVGAKEFIEAHRGHLLEKGDPTSLARYRAFVELYPIWYAECFRILAGDTGLDIEVIDKAITRLRRDQPTVRGNFKRIIDGIPLSSEEYIEQRHMVNNIEGRIEWFPDPDGRWQVSKILDPDQSNLKFRKDDTWFPSVPDRFTHCADPFKFLNKTEAQLRTDKSRLSKGGGSCFWERDTILDPQDKDIADWQSHRFVCTYVNRTADEDAFAEDMLMQNIYYGGLMFPEINVRIIWKHYVKRGYGGYLKYAVDEATGRIKTDRPGFTSLAESKQDLFNAVKTYIKWHGHREQHLDFIMECKKIRGIEYMTDFDLFTACGGCLLGSRSSFAEVVKQATESFDLESVFQQYTYN